MVGEAREPSSTVGQVGIDGIPSGGWGRWLGQYQRATVPIGAHRPGGLGAVGHRPEFQAVGSEQGDAFAGVVQRPHPRSHRADTRPGACRARCQVAGGEANWVAHRDQGSAGGHHGRVREHQADTAG